MTKNNQLVTINNFLAPELLYRVVSDAMKLMPDMDTYDNPFESKLILDQSKYPDSVREATDIVSRLRAYFEGTYEAIINGTYDTYYTAFFVYRPGDRLQRHIDTAISPQVNRKVVVANVYFTECDGGEFVYDDIEHPIRSNMLLAFPNHNTSWHAVRPIKSGYRVVLTMGFLGYREDMTRMDQKAYFAPERNEIWTPAQHALRDQRAGIYKTN